MKQIIKKLEVVSGNYYKRWEVGLDGITKIEDRSIEYPNSVWSLYFVYKNETQIAQVENASIVVEYAEGNP